MEILSIFALLNLGIAELLLLIFTFIPKLIAIINITSSKFKGNQQIVWLLIAIFVPLGAIIYFIFGRKNRIKSA